MRVREAEDRLGGGDQCLHQPSLRANQHGAGVKVCFTFYHEIKRKKIERRDVIYLSIYLFVYLSIYLSQFIKEVFYLSIYLFITIKEVLKLSIGKNYIFLVGSP